MKKDSFDNSSALREPQGPNLFNPLPYKTLLYTKNNLQ